MMTSGENELNNNSTDFGRSVHPSSPLSGKGVVITRAAHQMKEFEALLRDRGGRPILYPCIAIIPPRETNEIDTHIRAAAEGAFDRIVLTSTNTVVAMRDRITALCLEETCLAGLPAAAIGSSTAEVARTELGLQVDIVPGDFTARSLAAAIEDVNGKRIFLPQADIARPTMREELAKAGACVTAVAAYRTIPAEEGGEPVVELIAAGSVDYITFTSPSTVTNFLYRYDSEGGRRDQLKAIAVACIGPVTADSARDHGFEVHIMPDENTISGLVSALESHAALQADR
jgi:uroporphyrinogen III methyltransferase/synthase